MVLACFYSLLDTATGSVSIPQFLLNVQENYVGMEAEMQKRPNNGYKKLCQIKTKHQLQKRGGE